MEKPHTHSILPQTKMALHNNHLAYSCHKVHESIARSKLFIQFTKYKYSPNLLKNLSCNNLQTFFYAGDVQKD